jgi:hypothetical protein
VIARAVAIAVLASASIVTTAAAAPAPDLTPAARIQRRFVEKKRRFAAYAGFAYLGRGDFYRSPGVEVAASFYVWEPLAIDLRAAWFFTSPTDELRAVVEKTGFTPDSRPSQAAVLAGARYSLGYAKLRVTSRLTLHFEPQVFLYGGVHVTHGDTSPTSAGPMFAVGLGFLVHATPRIQARIDAGMTIGAEERTTWVAVLGGNPTLSVGVMF